MLKFTKVFLGAASATLLTVAAHAADSVASEQPPEAVLVPGFTWTGFYVGANVGYSSGDFDHPIYGDPIFLDPISDVLESDGDGVTGGVQIGYNWQVNSFVLGVEADIQAASVDGTFRHSDSFFLNQVLFIDTAINTKLDWFGTARLRAGYVPTERLMIYGTGGFAFGETTSSARFDGEGAFGGSFSADGESKSTTRTGWAAGRG
nr:outer membrane beta-barrel protein [Mesorhizobium sp.]